MGQLGKQAERRGQRVRRRITLKAPAVSCRPATRQQFHDIRLDALARRIEGLGEIVDDRSQRRFAGAALEDFARDCVGLEHALRREQHPAALRLVVRQPHAARQARASGRRRICVTRLRSCGHSSGANAPGGMCFGVT